MLLAIDPGAFTGWAHFVNKEMVACGLNYPELAIIPGITAVVIERPHSAKTKAPVKDVITLALRAGEWAGRCMVILPGLAIKYLEPAQWKGSVPKNISEARTRALLSSKERTILAAAEKGISVTKINNVVDAIGIGLAEVGR